MITPQHDWLLVRLDPLPTHSGLIQLLHGGRVRTGTVQKVGPGKRLKSGLRVPLDVASGEKIAFYRENLEHQQGKELTRITMELDAHTALLRESDVLFVLQEEVAVS